MSDDSPGRELDRPRTRASDADRDAVLDVLASAHATGRLDVVEFDERQSKALATKFVDEFAVLVADLPEGRDLATRLDSMSGVAQTRSSVPAVVGDGTTQRTFAVMGGSTVVVAPNTPKVLSISLMGGDDLYLGDVLGPGVEITIESYAVMGGNTIYVPAGTRIIDRSVNLMGGNDMSGKIRGDGSDGTIILTGFTIMGGNEIKLDE